MMIASRPECTTEGVHTTTSTPPIEVASSSAACVGEAANASMAQAAIQASRVKRLLGRTFVTHRSAEGRPPARKSGVAYQVSATLRDATTRVESLWAAGQFV